MTTQELYMKPKHKKYTVQMGSKNFVLNTDSNKPDNFAFSVKDEEGKGEMMVFGHLEEATA